MATRSLLSGLGEYVLQGALSGGWLKRKVFRKLRALLVLAGDPAVEANVDGRWLRLPLSHELPFHSANHPEYDCALPRLAEVIAHRRGSCAVIDIGANVGDTARALLDVPKCTVLCVEGSERFADFIGGNLAGFEGRYAVVRGFVGVPTAGLSLNESRGTARLEAASSDETLRGVTLSQAMEEAGFAAVDLLKIDTDGFDTLILRQEAAFLAEHRPVLFFEFFPDLFSLVDPDGFSIFEVLKQAGYSYGLSYANTGELLGEFSLREGQALEQHLALMQVSPSMPYLDICLFCDDAEFSAVRDAEAVHFARRGPNP